MNKCIIMSGGIAHRVRHLIGDGSKQMIMMGEKPILEYCIIESIEAGCDNVLVVTDPRKQDQNNFLLYAEKEYGIQTVSLECNRLMESIKIANSFVGDDDFVMMLPDMMTHGKITKNIIAAYHKYHKAIISFYENRNIEKGYLVEAVNVEGNVYDIVGFSKEKVSDFRVFGRYVFPKKTFGIINALPIDDSEVEILRLLISENMLYGVVIEEEIYDVGSPEGIEKVKRYCKIEKKNRL